MIFQLRFPRISLVMELLVVNGILVGFSLPDKNVRMLGFNFGPLCLCFHFEGDSPICKRCGRTLRWGLHGEMAGLPLCKPAKSMKALSELHARLSEIVKRRDIALSELHARLSEIVKRRDIDVWPYPRDYQAEQDMHWFYCLTWVLGLDRQPGENLRQWMSRIKG